MMQTLLKTKQKESATGTIWQQRDADERSVLTLMQKMQLPEVLARAIAARGIDLSQAEDFLSPTLKALLPSPFHLLDMEKAAERIVEYIIAGKNIAVFGDYDVDGATSSALLKRFFRMIGTDVTVYIPDRIEEGYGPNKDAFSYLKNTGVDLCITVDCGTLSFEPIKHAGEIGLEIIVVDHHLGSEKLPEAYAIVNPNRLDETSEYKYLAAVGVSFLLAVAVNSKLREKEFFADKKQPDLLSLLDIVALGTVCDVVPLTGINRAFVRQGLKIMKSRNNLGLKALCDVASMKEAPSAYHLGFVLGPRINAGGRVGKADLGSRLLTTENADEAYSIALELDRFNADRKAIEQQVQEEAMTQIEQNGAHHPVLFAIGEGWHPGVIGIVASRIKDAYNRPSAVISLSEGIGKASARSISGIDFGSAIVAANQSGLLIAGGGHAMAAGFTVAEDKIKHLFEFLCTKFGEDIEKYSVRKVKFDGYIGIGGITPELAYMLEDIAPFGTSNPEPRFVLKDVCIIKTDVIGADHIRCIIADAATGSYGGTVKAMAFRSLNTTLGEVLLSCTGRPVDIMAKIKLNCWQGIEKAELIIEDVAL